MDYLNVIKEVWNNKVEEGEVWTKPVSSEEVERAKNGEWKIILTPTKPVPREWFPESLDGLKVLCLASGGGQQGPIMAAVGCDVTVFDYCDAQLGQDKYVAERDGLEIKTVQGDMRDLSVFEGLYFANHYAADDTSEIVQNFITSYKKEYDCKSRGLQCG